MTSKIATTGVLLITHSSVGKALLDTATAMFGSVPKTNIQLLPVALDSDVDAITAAAQKLAAKLDSGNGVLVLTDAYGSTPNNVARALLNPRANDTSNQSDQPPSISVLAGVNLPMLIRVFNYPNKPHSELAQLAIEAGHEGIIQC